MKLTKAQQAHLRWATSSRARSRGGFWFTLLIYAALFVIADALKPKPELENAKPAGLGDFQFPTATEDRVIPILWGTQQIKGPNVIWYGDLRQEAITEKVRVNLWDRKTIITGFKYYVGIQFALCRGTVDKLLRIWIGETQVFNGSISHNGSFSIDQPNLFGGNDLGNGGVQGNFRFHAGTNTQAVSSYLSSFQQEGGNTPAYRGTAYLAPSASRTYIGNSTSIKEWKFEVRRIPNGLGLSTGQAELNSGNDCNPANVLYEIFTDTEWGLAQPASDIDTTSFTAAAATLATEGNGFSFLLDRTMDAQEIVSIIEEQIGGKVFFNMTTAKWTLKLARADYDIDTIPVISEANAIQIKDFTRGSWDDTTNIVRTKFTNRSNQYQDTFGLAQDPANVRIQDGANVATTVNLPGCKDSALANQVASRVLRTVSYPLAKATFIMDRSFYDTNPVDVFAFTSSQFGITKMPMRVTRVDLGDLENNRVTIDAVQDVFFFQVGNYADPTDTGWTAPSDSLDAFASDEQIAFEAPRAFVYRDPSHQGLPSVVWASGRRSGNEVTFKIAERHAAGTPSGNYNEAGESYGFMLIGELDSALSSGVASPTSTITITNTPDSQSDILAAFDKSRDEISDDPPSEENIGTNLINVVYVTNGTDDGEFMLVTSAVANGGSNVDMEDVYRGVMDSTQQSFSAGDQVFLLFAGGNSTLNVFNETDNVDIKLLPRSSTDQVLEASATAISLTMDKRPRRPYPPSRVSIGAAIWASTVSLESLGGGDDATGFEVDFIRRDYRIAEGGNEISALSTDAATLDSSFPSANSTTHDMELRNDPSGSNTLLHTDTGITGTSNDQNRTTILHEAGGTLPTSLRVVFTALHDDGADTDLTSRQDLVHDFSVTSALTGQFEFGDLDTNDNSAQYTVDAAGVHSFTIGTAFATTGDVEISINGGGFTTLIAQGNTSGNTSSLSVSDTIDIRHTSTDTGALTHLQMTAPGGGTDAWGILYV